MIIRHCSDTHGNFPEATQWFDITILSGDLFPDANTNGIEAARFQEHWLKRNKQRLLDWSQGKPTYYILGNHDWLNESSPARELGWVDINNREDIVADGVGIFGFPWIPYICGSFNYELTSDEMREKLASEVEQFADADRFYPDILVTHAPPYCILDKSYGGARYGCRHLANMYSFLLPPEKHPKLHLFGHIHESAGTMRIGNTVFSNAGTTQNYLEL